MNEKIRLAVLEGKTEREQLELKAHYALSDLSDYFQKKGDHLEYEVNRLCNRLDHLSTILDFPKT